MLSWAHRPCACLLKSPVSLAAVLQEDKLFRVNHTDPWVRNDPFRTSRTVAFQTTRSSGNAVHGRAADDVASREGVLRARLPCHSATAFCNTQLLYFMLSSLPWIHIFFTAPESNVPIALRKVKHGAVLWVQAGMGHLGAI